MAFDPQIAALTIFCEASSASQDERVAVAHTILNRLQSGKYGRTAAEVCLRRFQFSEWNDDQGDNSNLLRGARTPDTDSVMTMSLAAYWDALQHPETDQTHGSTHYHDKSISPPYWAAKAIKTLETKNFIFYKDVP